MVSVPDDILATITSSEALVPCGAVIDRLAGMMLMLPLFSVRPAHMVLYDMFTAIVMDCPAGLVLVTVTVAVSMAPISEFSPICSPRPALPDGMVIVSGVLVPVAWVLTFFTYNQPS